MKIDYQDRIDEYLLHRMSDEERMAFENEVNGDKELQEQLSYTEDVQQVLKSRNEKIAKMEEWQDDYEWSETSSKPRSSSRKVLYWISSIAAMFVIGFFLIQNIYVAKSPVEYMASSGMSGVTFRAGADNSDIEQLLSQEKYGEALYMIEEKCLALKDDSLELVQDITIDDERKEYDLQIVKDKQNELKWLKVHALLELHYNEGALLLLDELRNTEGYYQMSADSLYNQMLK